jgi:hypothetical protein
MISLLILVIVMLSLRRHDVNALFPEKELSDLFAEIDQSHDGLVNFHEVMNYDAQYGAEPHLPSPIVASL